MYFYTREKSLKWNKVPNQNDKNIISDRLIHCALKHITISLCIEIHDCKVYAFLPSPLCGVEVL